VALLGRLVVQEAIARGGPAAAIRVGDVERVVAASAGAEAGDERRVPLRRARLAVGLRRRALPDRLADHGGAVEQDLVAGRVVRRELRQDGRRYARPELVPPRSLRAVFHRAEGVKNAVGRGDERDLPPAGAHPLEIAEALLSEERRRRTDDRGVRTVDGAERGALRGADLPGRARVGGWREGPDGAGRSA